MNVEKKKSVWRKNLFFLMMNVKENADNKESGDRQAHVLPRRKL